MDKEKYTVGTILVALAVGGVAGSMLFWPDKKVLAWICWTVGMVSVISSLAFVPWLRPKFLNRWLHKNDE